VTAAWRDAILSHRSLLILSGFYAAAVIAEAIYCGVPLAEVAKSLRYAGMFLLAIGIFGLGLCAGCYAGILLLVCRQGSLCARATEALMWVEERATSYFYSHRFAYTCMGVLVLAGNCFFIINKSLINIINPLHRLKWDFVFAKWDKALHVGYYPHELLLPVVNALAVGRALDFLYFFWLNAIFLLTLFNLFGDDRPHRRLRFLWVYLLSWIILGSVMATVFNSVGPLFYHYFYPAAPDIYSEVARNIYALQKRGFLFAAMTRVWLIRWQTNDAMIDANAISAMPSMHVAIAWLAVLYAREVNRFFMWGAGVFFACIFISSIYLGFHYAIDGYVSVFCVSVLWWIVGRGMDRRFTRQQKLGDV